MIYIKPENVEFYDSLENKSDFINGCLQTALLGGVRDLGTKEISERVVGDGSETAQTQDAKAGVESMRERDLNRLREYRAKQGLYDPTKS